MRIGFLGNHAVSYSSENHHARTLELMGHTVIRFQEPYPHHVSDISTLECDLFVWIHTHGWQTPGILDAMEVLSHRGIPRLTYHLDLWMGLNRQKDMLNDPYWQSLDHFFTVDPAMAKWLNKNTKVTGHFLPPGVFGPECYLAAPNSPHGNDILFVGSRGYHPEWSYRPKLIDWLKETYGDRFTHVGGDGQVGTTRGHALNQLYASSKVVVGDSLCQGFVYPFYHSDRVPETLGRGGFLIHPYIRGMESLYTDGEHLVYYPFDDFAGLKETIDFYLDNDDQREVIRRAGHRHVRENHTYQRRWEQILGTVMQ